ncbi:amidase [Bordetella pertussis]|uniref:amidase n=1 Tax=Bordetella pertussis TaxID=520 RepID=UPI0005E5AC23|nr:amidase [Bordetella pertussis]CFM79886.1 amidase [Bordetella pertussis]
MRDAPALQRACRALPPHWPRIAALLPIRAHEPVVRAWRELDVDAARAQARRLDTHAARGLLAGVPIAVKDIFLTEQFPTRYGSPIYEHGIAGTDADCVARARAAGALVLGKTVTTEFAYFTPGPTANPRDPSRTPGDSSSGSAAAVAAGMVPLAFGSQTAGSLIRPASYCGVFALKPTHGLHSLAGAKAMAPSLDTLGWLARDAGDLELMRCALAGEDYRPLPDARPAALRLGICLTHEWHAIEPDGAQAFAHAQVLCTAAGAQLAPLVLPDALQGLMQAQQTIMAYEAARSLAAEWRDARARLSPAMQALIEAGLGCDAQSYAQALALAARGRAHLEHAMRDLDAVIAPAAPGEAPPGLARTGDPIFSRVWTLLGLPCVNVPGLAGPHGMPIGVQLIGRPGDERRLLAVAAALHRVFHPTGAPQ